MWDDTSNYAIIPNTDPATIIQAVIPKGGYSELVNFTFDAESTLPCVELLLSAKFYPDMQKICLVRFTLDKRRDGQFGLSFARYWDKTRKNYLAETREKLKSLGYSEELLRRAGFYD